MTAARSRGARRGGCATKAGCRPAAWSMRQPAPLPRSISPPASWWIEARGVRRLIRHAAAAFGAAAMAVLPAVAEPAGVPSPFVYVRDVAPTIVQDMRYAGAHNFIG